MPTPITKGKDGVLFPTKTDGSIDLDAMSAEQKADYWKQRSDEQTTGFNKFKEDKEKEIDALKNKKLEDKTLTEEQLRKQVSGYDQLSAREQELVKSAVSPFITNIQALSQQVAKILDKDKFETDFTSLVANDEYKILLNHRTGFKAYAYQDENLNTPISVLADSYIYKNKLAGTTHTERAGLEGGTSGDRKAEPKDGMTAEYVEHLRKTDPRKYNKLAREGKLRAK